MSTQVQLSPALLSYISQTSLRESELLQRLREETWRHPYGLMQICSEQGQFMAPSVQDSTTLALRALNHKLHRDQRVTLSMLPLGDGLTLARKRSACRQ